MSSISNHYVKYSARLSLINEMASSEPEKMVREVEEAYHQTLEEIARQIFDGNYKMIMLAGPSSSGKTTTSHILTQNLERFGKAAHTVSLDDFFLGEGKAPVMEDGRHDFESLEALNLPQMLECLSDLMEKSRCDMPVFNFETGAPEPFTRPLVLGERDIVIIEGIHALNPYVSQNLPKERLLKLYISVKQGICDEQGEIISAQELRFVRRMVRDYYFRASSPENTLDMWRNVCRGEQLNIQPFKRQADITINSIHLYEPCLFRNYALPMLELIPEDHPQIVMIRRIREALSRFCSISPSILPSNSMLREFLKF